MRVRLFVFLVDFRIRGENYEPSKAHLPRGRTLGATAGALTGQRIIEKTKLEYLERKNAMKKKVLSLFLALVMVCGLLPISALAVDPAQHHMADAAVAFLSGSS